MSRPALVALVALGAGPAFAQGEAVRFSYEAPSDCPSEEAFTARVRQRTTRGRDAAPEEMARTFAAKIRADAPGFTGTIEFLDDAGAPVSRRVHGEECDAVVSSLALIAALALDVTLREEQPPETEPAAEPAPPSRPAPPETQRERPRPRPVPAPVEPATRRERPWLESARVGLGAAYDTNLSAPSFGLLGQLDFRGQWALRLSLHYEDSTLEVDSGREVAVRLLGIEASVCPARVSANDFVLHACAAFDLGSLRARGVRSDALVSVSSETRLWAALGPELRFAWEPREAFWMELRGALPVPLRPHTFTLENPDRTAYDIPAISVQGGISAGVRFW